MNQSVRVEGFSIDECIYQGIKTRVYRGIRTSDGQRVILKATHLDELKGDRPKNWEYIVGKTINSPHVVSYLDTISTKDELVIIEADDEMTAVSGCIPTDGFDLPVFLCLAVSAAGGLAAIHGTHIIHKDINPGNLICSQDFTQLKYIDFSISSRIAEQAEQFTPITDIQGTLPYLSPE